MFCVSYPIINRFNSYLKIFSFWIKSSKKNAQVKNESGRFIIEKALNDEYLRQTPVYNITVANRAGPRVVGMERGRWCEC